MSEQDARRHAPVEIMDCGMAMAANLLGDRWTMLILREAFYGVVRFDDIQADIGVPRAVLTARLKQLVDINVIRREPYREPGMRTRHAYVLTDEGAELALPFIALMQWGDKYIRRDKPSVKIIDRDSKKSLQVALVDNKGLKVPVTRAAMVLAKTGAGR